MRTTKTIRGELENESKSLTHNLDEEFSFILSSRVGYNNGVVALIVFLRPLDYKAA